MHFDDGLVDGLELPSGSSASRLLIACRCRPLLRRRVGGLRAADPAVAVYSCSNVYDVDCARFLVTV
eukprot:6227144-Prymnesium_polylepis.1